MAKENENDVFSKNRIIYFNGTFTENKVQETIKKLLEYEVEDSSKDILMFIDTNGGYVDSFMAIHDTIKMLRSNVATMCIGKAMSCGAMLLISGTKGKRFITPNSRVLIHELSVSSSGKLSDISRDVTESERLQKIINSFILQYTEIKETEIENFMSKDSYITAIQAKELNVVDHIVHNYDEMLGKLNL